jgi:hypothetical protein
VKRAPISAGSFFESWRDCFEFFEVDFGLLLRLNFLSAEDREDNLIALSPRDVIRVETLRFLPALAALLAEAGM